MPYVESTQRKENFLHWKDSGTINTGDQDDVFLQTVTDIANTNSTGAPWAVNLTLNGQPVQFKINIRTNITVIG